MGLQRPAGGGPSRWVPDGGSQSSPGGRDHRESFSFFKTIEGYMCTHVCLIPKVLELSKPGKEFVIKNFSLFYSLFYFSFSESSERKG